MTLHTCPNCHTLSRPGPCPACGSHVAPSFAPVRSVASVALALFAVSSFIGCSTSLYGVAAVPLLDDDGDGFGVDQDCDDTNPDAFPGAPEVPDNGLDDDCDGVVDEAAS